jgi:glycine betaine/proline transport system permease protein
VLVYLSRTYLWAAEFPADVPLGSGIAQFADTASSWTQTHLSVITLGFKNFTTNGILNPMQSLLVASPWWVSGGALAALAAIIGGGAVARLTSRPLIRGAARQLILAALAAAITYGIGHLVGGTVA